VWSLRHLAVDPSTRHAGHGAALVDEGARRARAAGATELAIGIVAENTLLAAWYRRLGFESLGTNQYPGLVFTVERLRLLLDADPLAEPEPASSCGSVDLTDLGCR
jgi:ribosomal protein S18 acetylase RimI-like enzyme